MHSLAHPPPPTLQEIVSRLSRKPRPTPTPAPKAKAVNGTNETAPNATAAEGAEGEEAAEESDEDVDTGAPSDEEEESEL